MKKIIGILGVATFALAMFFNVNVKNNSKKVLSLTSLTTLNVANANSEDDETCDYTEDFVGGGGHWCWGTGTTIC